MSSNVGHVITFIKFTSPDLYMPSFLANSTPITITISRQTHHQSPSLVFLCQHITNHHHDFKANTSPITITISKPTQNQSPSRFQSQHITNHHHDFKANSKPITITISRQTQQHQSPSLVFLCQHITNHPHNFKANSTPITITISMPTHHQSPLRFESQLNTNHHHDF